MRDLKKLKRILQLAKVSIEAYQQKESFFYLDYFSKNAKTLDQSITNYLWARYWVINDDYNLAINYLKKIHTGIFYDKSKYLLAKINFAQNNFLDGDNYFQFRLKRGEKIDRKLYFEDKLNCSIWNFEKGRILLWQDFAIGETVLLLRLISLIEIKDMKIDVLIDPRLIPLFISTFKNINFIDYNKNINKNDYDYHLPIGSLIKLLKNFSLDDKNTLPNLKLNKEIVSDNNNICLFLSGDGNKDHKHKQLSEDNILKILINLRDNHTFTLINYGKSYDYYLNFLKKNNFKIKFHNLDIYNDFSNLSKVLLGSKMSIMTSCSEAYISAAIGVKTIILYNQNFSSHWMWHNSNKNSNKNYWFNNLFTFKFKWKNRNCILTDELYLNKFLDASS